MARKEDKSSPDHAYLSEASINADGTADLIIGVRASTAEGIDRVKKKVDRLIGKEGEIVARGKGSSFGFSSSRWNSPWSPTGPKPNWGRPPKDPHAN